MLYGFTLTDAGRALIAGWTAGRIAAALTIAEVTVGSGTPPEGATWEDVYAYKDLIAPVAAATSTVPAYDGSAVHFTVEYRNDLNGGLADGFALREIGIFVEHPSMAGERVLFAYYTLGDKPQHVAAYVSGSADVRRFPVVIDVGSSVEVRTLYDATAFLTAADVAQYITIVILPQFVSRAKELIAEHNASPEAHPDLRAMDIEVDARLKRLEDMFINEITGNPFLITFGSLDGVAAEGVWNRPMQRVEF
jgi:hypothetical protein